MENEYVYLDSHYILVYLKDILMIEKAEDKENKIITLIYKDKQKIELDYADIKDDVNSEKTVIQKDFEFLIDNLKFGNEEIIKLKNEIKEKDKKIEFYKQLYEINRKELYKFNKIKYLMENKENIIKKFRKIKEIIND